MNVWPTCNCPACTRIRSSDVSGLVDIILTKNNTEYRKGGPPHVYEFSEDPNEVPLALTVLSDRLERDVDSLGEDALAKVASIPNVIIHVQGPCDEPPQPEHLDCSAIIQKARQEIERRRK